MPEVPKKLVPVKKETVPITRKREVQPEKGIYREGKIEISLILIMVLMQNHISQMKRENDEGKEKKQDR